MCINWKTRELNLNIVYYGPALSGKTTNLEKIHARLKPEVRSELFTLQVGLASFQGELNTPWNYVLAMTVMTLLPITLSPTSGNRDRRVV